MSGNDPPKGRSRKTTFLMCRGKEGPQGRGGSARGLEPRFPLNLALLLLQFGQWGIQMETPFSFLKPHSIHFC